MTVHEHYQRHGGKRKTLRDKIEFPKNVAVEVALAYATGKEGENGNGGFFTYSTIDDRVFFATPVLNQKIQALAPVAGERLEIELRNNRITGNRNLWDVRRASGGGAVAAKPAPAPEPLPVNGSGESMLDICMKSAIDVCVRGQKYAAQKGLTLVFAGEDIRTIMNTLMIGAQKGAR